MPLVCVFAILRCSHFYACAVAMPMQARSRYYPRLAVLSSRCACGLRLAKYRGASQCLRMAHATAQAPDVNNDETRYTYALQITTCYRHFLTFRLNALKLYFIKSHIFCFSIYLVPDEYHIHQALVFTA